MLSLLFLGSLLAQPPVPVVKLPAELSGSPGRLVRLQAETSHPHVRWYLTSDEGELVPFPDGKTALFCSPKPGRYVVLAWTASGDQPSDAAKCVIDIGDRPAPPSPPVPPRDAFAEDLRRLYAGDSTADKSSHVAQLAALYREAIRFTEQADVATSGDLAERIRAAASSLMPADVLVKIRQRIAEEITAELSTNRNKLLDAATRKQAAKLFGRIAKSLEELK